MKPRLYRAAAVLAACSNLCSCASVDQVEFDREAHGLVHEGMPALEAVPSLENAGFVCSADGSNPPTFDCVRIRDRLIASCVERVTFVEPVENHGAVADVKIASIACAGT